MSFDFFSKWTASSAPRVSSSRWLSFALFQELQKQHEYVISKQLLRCGTSIGANVEEATAGQNRKDFLLKMTIASKEARETKYWLLLLQQSDLASVDVTSCLVQVEEIIRILTSIVKTTSENP